MQRFFLLFRKCFLFWEFSFLNWSQIKKKKILTKQINLATLFVFCFLRFSLKNINFRNVVVFVFGIFSLAGGEYLLLRNISFLLFLLCIFSSTWTHYINICMFATNCIRVCIIITTKFEKKNKTLSHGKSASVYFSAFLKKGCHFDHIKICIKTCKKMLQKFYKILLFI